jgi:dehydrogenase/reductase SDR family member 7B
VFLLAIIQRFIQAFCDSLRAEIAESNVKVTLISPGYVATSLSLNALTGKGDNYGAMDEATAAGYNRFELANEILQHVLADRKDVMIMQLAPRLARWIRHLCPCLYFWIMEQRAKKLKKQQTKKNE